MSKWRKVAMGVVAVGACGGILLCGGAGYQVATAESSMLYPDTPYPEASASTDPAVIEQGRYLAYGPAHCAQCHSTPDREHPEKILTSPLSGGLAFHMGPIASLYAPNLTPDPETGIGRFTDAELLRTLETGVRPNHQFSMFMGMGPARLSREDSIAIISFLRSIPPVRNDVPPNEFKLMGKLMLPMFPMTPRVEPPPAAVPAGPEPSLARGAYVVEHVAACTFCHSPMNPMTGEITGAKGSGSLPEPSHGSDSDREFVAPNLTSDPSGVTGKLDEEAFVARMRAGRVFASSIMPWENFTVMTDADLRSVYRYLRTLPPVHNDLGPTYREAGWEAPAP